MLDAKWPAGTRNVKYVLVTLLLLSLVLFALAVTSTVQIVSSTNYSGPGYRWPPSASTVFFYAAAVPLGTFIAFSTESILYLVGFLHPVISLIWTIIALGIYLYILTLWAVCESSPDSGGEGCPAFWVLRGSGYPGDASRGVWIARLTLGGIVVVLLFVYLGLAARSVDLQRRARRAEKAAARADSQGSVVPVKDN